MPPGVDVILCSPSCGIAPDSTSGGEVLERELVTALRRGGDDPHILLAKHKPAPEGLTIERPRIGRGLRWWVMPFVMSGGILRCWERHRFDALRAHSALYLGPACHLAARRLGVPWVAHIQHVDRPHPVEGWALRKAARVVTISCFSREQIIRTYGVRPERVAVIPPGVDHAAFYPKRDKRYSRDLLFVGGLKSRKRPLMLLDILERIPDATLTVVGDGPLRHRFLEAVEERGLNARVLLWTGVRDFERPMFYRNADVFVSGSALEGFGMPVLEAMACGLPVVTFANGALPELVPHHRCAEEGDLADFARRVRALLDKPDLARTIGEINRLSSLDYSWERCAREVRRVCEEVAR